MKNKQDNDLIDKSKDIEVDESKNDVKLTKYEGDVKMKVNINNDDTKIDTSDTDSDNTVVLSDYPKQNKDRKDNLKDSSKGGIIRSIAITKTEQIILK